MNTVTPIIINHTPARCPSCNCDEDTMVVCRECSYEYNTEPMPLLSKIMITLVIWFGITLIYWIGTVIPWGDFPHSNPEQVGVDPHSLIDVIVSQWDFVIGLRIW